MLSNYSTPNKGSLPQGFTSILGPLPVHFAMFLTLLGTVQTTRDEDLQHLYWWTWVMHLVMAFVILANSQLKDYLGVTEQGLVTFALFFMIVVIVNDCMALFQSVDPEQDNADPAAKAEEQPKASSLMPVEESMEPNRKMLLTWFAIEGLIFTANLLSNAIVILSSICCRKTNLIFID